MKLVNGFLEVPDCSGQGVLGACRLNPLDADLQKTDLCPHRCDWRPNVVGAVFGDLPFTGDLGLRRLVAVFVSHDALSPKRSTVRGLPKNLRERKAIRRSKALTGRDLFP